MVADIAVKIDAENRSKAKYPSFKIGDTIRISVKIKEGDKERVQAYSGTLIARHGSGATETITVRKVSFGEDVERIFPLHSPNIVDIKVEASGKAGRAKLYYLRERTGKQARLASVET